MDDPAGKRAAQARVDRIRAFREELAELERAGAVALPAEERRRLDEYLDATQAALAGKYDVDVTPSERQISWGMRIASSIGALALCAAVFLFFYRFWGDLSTTVQVLLLAATPLAVAGAAAFAARREKTLYYTGLAGAVAFAALVLNLNVLGSIFNLTPSPNAFLAWSAFGLALAYAYGLRLLLGAGLICACAWLAMQTMALAGYLWSEALQRPENLFLPGMALVALPAVVRHGKRAEFPALYRLLGLLAVYLVLLVLSFNGRQSYLPWQETNVKAFYQVLGFAATAAGIWWGISHQWTGVVNLSAAFFVINLYSRLFDWWWDLMPKYLLFLLVGAISLALLAAFQKVRVRLRAREGGIAASKRGEASPEQGRVRLPWTPGAFPFAIAVVAAADAFVLAHAAINRSGSPEATIELTERELPAYRSASAENTGMSVFLTLTDPGNFSAAQLKAAGLDFPQPAEPAWYRPPRFAFAAIEFSGPGWLQWNARHAEMRQVSPALSRLAAVDVGRTAEALRAKYPDRSRYVIVPASVGIGVRYYSANAKPVVSGSVRQLLVREIHVPVQFHAAIEQARRSAPGRQGYAVTLCYGRYHEPWIAAVRARPKE